MFRRLSRLIVMMIFAFALLLVSAACKGGGAPVMSGEIKIEAGEFYFKPANITVKAGTPVKFVVTNAGKIEHDFSFPSLGLGLGQPGHIPSGGTASLEATFSQPGSYVFICSVPGHAEAGMKGTVTVVK